MSSPWRQSEEAPSFRDLSLATQDTTGGPSLLQLPQLSGFSLQSSLLPQKPWEVSIAGAVFFRIPIATSPGSDS